MAKRTLAQVLKAAREAKKLSQPALAELAGVNQSTISRLEKPPTGTQTSLNIIMLVALKLGVEDEVLALVKKRKWK